MLPSLPVKLCRGGRSYPRVILGHRRRANIGCRYDRFCESHKLCNLPLSELGTVVKCRVLVCAVSRAGTAVAPTGNFVLKEGDRIFVTAPTDNLILPGIARAHLIRACEKLAIPVSETPFTVADLKNADEIIVQGDSVKEALRHYFPEEKITVLRPNMNILA